MVHCLPPIFLSLGWKGVDAMGGCRRTVAVRESLERGGWCAGRRPHKQAAPVSFILMDIQEMKGLLRWWPLRFSHCNHQIALLEASPLLKGGAFGRPPSSILLHSSEFDCNKAHNSNHKQQHKLQQKRNGMPFALRGEDDDADWKEKKLLTCLAGVYLHAKLLLQDARWGVKIGEVGEEVMQCCCFLEGDHCLKRIRHQ